MTDKNEFNEKFRSICMPILAGFEEERKQKFHLCITIIAVAAFVFLTALLLGRTGMVKFPDWAVYTIIGLTFLAVGVVIFIAKDFEVKVKTKVMPELCKCFGDLTWSQGDSINHQIFKNAGILTERYNQSEVDDVFKGTINVVPIEIDEVCYIYEKTERRNGKTTTIRHTVFDGLFITLGMNKNFSCHTVIKPDSLVHQSPLSSLKRTELEDVVFEKNYDVFTNDEVEGRYLVTPSFMERINNIKNVFQANKVSCAFYNDKFYIALETNKDMFVLGRLWKPADDAEQFMQMYRELASIIKLIDYFKLDQKIGL